MSTITIMQDVSALNKLIDGTIKSITKMQGIVQGLLMSVTYHAVAHGNIDPMLRLWDGMPKGVRRAAIQSWLDTYAPVVIDKESGFKFSREKMATLSEFESATEPTLTEAQEYALSLSEHDWTEHKPEQLALESFDVASAVAALLKKVAKLEKDGTKIKGAAVLAKLKAVSLADEEPAGDDSTDQE